MGLAKIVEIDDRYKPSQANTQIEYLITNLAEASDFAEKANLDRIDELTQSIQTIDDKIIALVRERNNAAISLENVINDSIGWSKPYVDVLAKAWETAKFKSTIVKKAVEKVRSLFFNETDYKAKFSKINFCNLKIDYGYEHNDAAYLQFIFAKGTDASTAFSIQIPMNGTIHWDQKNSSISGKYCLSKCCGGRYGSFVMAASYRLEDIRNAVTSYVVDGKTTKMKYESALHKNQEKILKLLVEGNEKLSTKVGYLPSM